MRTRRTGWIVVLVAFAGAAVALPALWDAELSSHAVTPMAGPRGALDHHGRWLVDESGRVVQLHGVNFVSKWPADDPATPAEVGFDADDAAFIRAQGWNVVRLGFAFNALMPTPGVIDQTYLQAVAETARTLGDAGVYVLLDMHQDGYGPLVHGNGFPDWATITDGLPNPVVGFPLYYVQNPALQRAFENFWENEPGPDAVPLQEHYGSVFTALAAELGHEPYVLGYDTMNEPWPGADWMTCASPGCPDLEESRLAPFAERMVAAIRSEDPRGLVFTEPFVLFNFGHADTALSGFGAPHSGLSFHVYALSPDDDEAVVDRAVAASDRGDALLATEFGATNDVATIERLTDDLDTRLVPWVFWAYEENVIIDDALPPTESNVRGPVVAALARPYATATNGTPVSFAYDPASRTLDYEFVTTHPDGSAAARGLTTVLEAPLVTYPGGYTVEVTGADVVSEPNAPQLVLCNREDATTVMVRVVAGSDPSPPEPVDCEVDADEPGPRDEPGSPDARLSGPADAPVAPAAAPATAVATDPRFTG